MTLEEQLDFFDRRAERALIDGQRWVKNNRGIVLAVARERLIANYPVFGDTSFRRPYDELVQEEIQEYADAPNWRLMRLWQGWT